MKDTRYKLFKPAEADKIAAKLNAESHAEDGDGWDYKVIHDPTGKGYSFIEIWDDEGYEVGRL